MIFYLFILLTSVVVPIGGAWAAFEMIDRFVSFQQRPRTSDAMMRLAHICLIGTPAWLFTGCDYFPWDVGVQIIVTGMVLYLFASWINHGNLVESYVMSVMIMIVLCPCIVAVRHAREVHEELRRAKTAAGGMPTAWGGHVP